MAVEVVEFDVFAPSEVKVRGEITQEVELGSQSQNMITIEVEITTKTSTEVDLDSEWILEEV